MLVSKTSRQIALAVLVGLTIEYTIIYVVCLFIASDATWFFALIGLLGLYAFRLANAAVNLLVGAAVYYLTKKQRVNAVIAMLYQHNIPVNEETRFADGDGLLHAIAASKDTTPEAKKFALMSLGELSGIRLSNRWLGLFQIYTVIDAAWERYRSEVDAKSGGL